MGNNQDKNDDFGSKLNMDEYNKKMSSISGQYSNHNQVINPFPQKVVQSKTQHFEKFDRKNALYKPTINIHLNETFFQLTVQYDSQKGCFLEIYVGVNVVNQDQVQLKTVNIQSKFTFKQALAPGKKLKFNKKYQILGDKTIINQQVILRIVDQIEATEYSLKKQKTGSNHWIVILQKFQNGDKSYELQNIYGSGDGGLQCIVCMTDLSNTLVKPCNHLCLCNQCSKHVKQSTNKCPICRNPIQSLVTMRNT